MIYEKPYLLKIDATSKTRGDRGLNGNRSVYKDLSSAIKAAKVNTENNGECGYWIRHRVWIIDRNADPGEDIVFDWTREE